MERLRIRFKKESLIRFISHLDLMRAFMRAMRRANLPLAYTKGYHPHPRISFGPPLPLGMTGRGEFTDIFLQEEMDVGEFIMRVNGKLSQGIKVEEARQISKRARSLVSLIDVATYRVCGRAFFQDEELGRRIDQFLKKDEIIIKRKRKERERINIRPLIMELRLLKYPPLDLMMTLRLGVRPQEVLEPLFGMDRAKVALLDIERVGLFVEREGRLLSPMEDEVIEDAKGTFDQCR